MSTQIFSERLISASGGLERFDNSTIVHVSSPEAFASAHIPGAALITPMDLLLGQPPAAGKIAPKERLSSALARIGYDRDKTIVVYDDEGGGWAGRFIWTLDVIGHTNWQYIDGGLHAWAASGGELASGAATPENPVNPVNEGAAFDLVYDEKLIADCDDLIRRVTEKDPTLAIWDARSAAEHTGARSGSARAGRIPGSANLDWLEVMDQNNHLCLREDLQDMLNERGLTADKNLVVHCQTHHRSGLAYLAATLLNYPQVQAYDGSWAEWGNREDTPIVSGPADNAADTSA